jgi:hypothetical protein
VSIPSRLPLAVAQVSSTAQALLTGNERGVPWVFKILTNSTYLHALPTAK